MESIQINLDESLGRVSKKISIQVWRTFGWEDRRGGKTFRLWEFSEWISKVFM